MQALQDDTDVDWRPRVPQWPAIGDTMATAIHNNFQPNPRASKWSSRNASSAPVNANGNAKTECSNLIISSVSRNRFQKAIYFILNSDF